MKKRSIGCPKDVREPNSRKRTLSKKRSDKIYERDEESGGETSSKKRKSERGRKMPGKVPRAEAEVLGRECSGEGNGVSLKEGETS